MCGRRRNTIVLAPPLGQSELPLRAASVRAAALKVVGGSRSVYARLPAAATGSTVRAMLWRRLRKGWWIAAVPWRAGKGSHYIAENGPRAGETGVSLAYLECGPVCICMRELVGAMGWRHAWRRRRAVLCAGVIQTMHCKIIYILNRGKACKCVYN